MACISVSCSLSVNFLNLICEYIFIQFCKNDLRGKITDCVCVCARAHVR